MLQWKPRWENWLREEYNQINLLNGYGILTIVSPREVTFDDPNEYTD